MIRTADAALFVALIENGRAASRCIFDQTRGALEFLHRLLKVRGALCCVGNEEVNADKRLGTIDVTEPNIVTENTAVVDSMRNEMLRAIPPSGRLCDPGALVKNNNSYFIDSHPR